MVLRLSRGSLVAIAALSVSTSLLGFGLMVVPRFAQQRAVSAAASRGVDLTVGRVRIAWLALSLDDVGAHLSGVEGAEARFATVRVDLDGRLGVQQVAGLGGHASVRDEGTFAAQFAEWRARRIGTGGPSERRSPLVDLRFDDVAMTAGPDVKGVATGVRIRREADSTELTVAAVDAAAGAIAVGATDVQVKFGGGPLAFRSAHLGAASVAWVIAAKTEVPGASSAVVPTAPPLPPEAPRVSKGRRVAPKVGEAPAPIPPLVPDLHALRSTLGAFIESAGGRLPVGADVGVDALAVRVQKGDEELTLGSGKLEVSRDDRRIVVNFRTSPLAQATPLSLRAELPTGGGDFELSVSGGPVPLGLLGMHDGGLLHLLEVDRTSFGGRGRVVLDERGQALTFDVEGAVRGLSVREPRLARDPVRGLDFSVSARGLLDDKGGLRLDAAEATIGAAHASLHGGLSQAPDRLAASFDFDFPTSSCQALLTSVPSALVPTVSGARMDGTLSLRGHLAFDTRNLDAIAFKYDAEDHCRLVDVPSDLDRARFTRSFAHVIYTKAGEKAEEITGPGTPNWSDLDDVSPYMQVAVLTTEDGAFFHHHGFNHAAIRNAVVANIKARRFVRGASTITMQLAKNLFLSREKTLARKLEELILADYLEQAFTKDEMMELYLNIIEFGPDLYGVTQAAEHYFGRRPNELNLAECMFLSSILPNPIAFHRVFEEGQLGDGWMRTIRARMDLAARNGLISPAELAEGLTEPVVFHRPGAPPVTPRPPVSTPTHPATTVEWQELN